MGHRFFFLCAYGSGGLSLPLSLFLSPCRSQASSPLSISLLAPYKLSLFVTIYFSSLSFVFLPLRSLPLSPYSKQASFFNWFMRLIPLNRLCCRGRTKILNFHYCREQIEVFIIAEIFFFVCLMGWNRLVRSVCIWRCSEESQVWVSPNFDQEIWFGF